MNGTYFFLSLVLMFFNFFKYLKNRATASPKKNVYITYFGKFYYFAKFFSLKSPATEILKITW